MSLRGLVPSLCVSSLLLCTSACTNGGSAEKEEKSADAETPPPAEGDQPAEPERTGPELPPPYSGDPLSTTTTDSGLVISDYVEGDGAVAEKGMDVAVDYTGYLETGLQFDSSRRKGRPFPFTVGMGKVIDGWDEGVIGMKVGGKRLLEVPPELGYGNRRAGKIPPNSRLWFTVELVAAYPPLPDPKGDEAFAGKPLSKQKLDDGLVIEVYAEGEGEPASKGDTVLVHYTGKLAEDGTVFSSSVPGKKPITFRLGAGRVIDGWDRGLEGMKVGGLRRLRIPSELGYGEKGKGEIPSNADLVFTVELMAIR
jgi:peptidylprolyl isomerase